MPITIREADLPRDEEQILALAQAFIDSTPYGQFFPPKEINVRELMARVALHGVIFVAEDASEQLVGVIGGGITTHLMFEGKYCEEAIWFVKPSARGGIVGRDLLRRLVEWSTTNGAVMCKMAAPAESQVGLLLDREGFARVETNFIRLLAAPTNPNGVVVHGVDADDLQRHVRRERQGGRSGKPEPTPHDR